ncbi:MAG TPA: hypothetical protein VL157_06045 [Gemmatimonadaceae bacterium]|nr:hypothetical protein [Gemmatimonadaceae bacterium]
MTSTWARRALVVAAVIATGPAALHAQDYFGQNQVQYRNFDWQVIETDHFLIHYYPDEREAAMDAARLAERAYARLSRVLSHEFREKKPIMVFASRSDFGQNNVTGDLGEGTGGVTEPLRDRMLLPFTGDYRSFEHVLTHEMVHEFQFDIFQHGHGAGAALPALTAVDPPLWFMEGMAEYLSIGPDDPHTATIIRDAALNDNLPSMRLMTERPDLYFPYRYGESFWAYVGQRWGDDVIGAILSDAASLGVPAAFSRETGMSLDDLGNEWRSAMRERYLPPVARLERPRTFSQPLLTERRSGGQIFLAPALSPDGHYIVFLSNGSFIRGQVFIDLWLADARTGKRIARLVKSTFDPNFEELQILYSQSAFSPDSKRLAFTALGEGKEELYILDVATRKRIAQIHLPLDGITSPSWSPDAKHIVFSGDHGGITDLYTINADGTGLRQLTSDRYGDLQPQWSPDGSTIAFATDRGDGADLAQLRFPKMRIALYHLRDASIDVLPGQSGLNINPMWAPDGQSIAFVSNRTGIENLFLADLVSGEQHQLTHVVGGVSAITEVSPAISWAPGTDRLVYTYYDDGNYSIWSVDHPRALIARPEGPAAQTVAQRNRSGGSGSGGRAAAASVERASPSPGDLVPNGVDVAPSEASRAVPAPGNDLAGDTVAHTRPPVTVEALLDSADLTLPDSTTFKRYKYHVRFAPDYVARPSVGYGADEFGNGVYGGTAVILSDMTGDNQLAFAGAVNGRVSDAQVFAGYTNLGQRFQYSTGIYQQPYYFANGYGLQGNAQGFFETQIITRYMVRQTYGVGIYPLDRFTRIELGMRLTNLQRSDLVFTRQLDSSYTQIDPFGERDQNARTVNYAQPLLAYVSDNVLWGFTSPIYGRRYRFQVQPAVGSLKWTEYLADYRRYDPILFSYLTVATRVMANVSTGRDADSLRKYIAYSDEMRGYDGATFSASQSSCPSTTTAALYRCSPLLGSSLAMASAELRFPIVRGGTIAGVIPIPPIEGAFFYDVGTAWFSGQDVVLHRVRVTDPTNVRGLLTSHGVSLRVNMFNYAILGWSYVIPTEATGHRGVWQFSIYPPF